jgi:branched-chain amino acid transport system substrate-binding protein
MRRIGWAAIFAGATLAGELFAGQLRFTMPPTHGVAGSEILVGISNVQTGPSAWLGQDLVLGSRAYWEMVNKSGGIYGRKISIVLKDDKYEPDPAIQNTNELITKDKIFFLFDYVGTPTLTRVLPLLKYYEEQKIVNVAPFTGAAVQRRPPYGQFVFNIRASYKEETSTLVRYLYGKGYRRFGFFGQADAYGKSGEVGIAEALQKFGLKPVAAVAYKRNVPFETDMSEQMRLLREAGTDVVVTVGSHAACAAFIRDARIADWKVPVAGVSFVGARTMLDKLKEASAKSGKDLTINLINSQVVPSPDDESSAMVREYRAHVAPEHYGSVSVEGWLNAVVVTEALRRAGPAPSREDFIRAMESLGGWDPGTGVKLEFSASNHLGMHRVWLTKTENGHWVPETTPEEMVASKP